MLFFILYQIADGCAPSTICFKPYMRFVGFCFYFFKIVRFDYKFVKVDYEIWQLSGEYITSFILLDNVKFKEFPNYKTRKNSIFKKIFYTSDMEIAGEFFICKHTSL